MVILLLLSCDELIILPTVEYPIKAIIDNTTITANSSTKVNPLFFTLSHSHYLVE